MVMGYLKQLNIFRRKPPERRIGIPQAVPAPEGYASQVAVSQEPRDQAGVVREMDGDYQVSFARKILAANISAVQVTISADGTAVDQRTAAIVDSLTALWKDSVGAMQDAIGQGRRAFEKTWDYDSTARINTIRKLEPLEPEDSRLNLADGDFAGIDIKLADSEWETIDPANAWWLALQPTAKYPHGRSLYFPAMHKAWQEKRKTVENLSRFVKRFAVRGGVAHIPFTERDPETQQVIDTASKTAESLECLYAGGTLLLPNDLHPGSPDGEKYKYDFTEANTQTLDPAPLLNVIDSWDVAILRAIGIPEKTVMEGSAVGSFAMVSQQMLTLFAVIESILNDFVKSFQKYVVDAVVAANFSETNRPKITVSFPSLTNRPDSFVAEVLKLLFANPGFQQAILEGGIDLRQMLTTAGIPLVDGFEAIVQNVAARTAATQQVAGPAVGMGGDPASPAGEFGSLSTLQWRRNIKAIKEALADFASGTASEVMTLQLLQSLGLSTERAQALMDDARDGTAEDPELQQAGMANTAKPRGLGIAVPTQEALLREALDEFETLFDRLLSAMVKNDSVGMANIRKEIIQLQADMRVASRALGMLSLWSPSINTYADGEAKQIQTAIRLANDSPGTRFPWLRKAMDWLFSKNVVTASQFAKMSAADKRTVLSVPGVESVQTLKSIRSKLTDALGKGTDLREFRKQIEEDVALTRAQTETLYRTNMKQGYVAGMDNALSSPAVADEFPYVIFRSTPDTRVRDEHWDLDGFVCLRSDPAYGILKAALNDWNCRCSMAPLTEAQAKRYTIRTYADLPSVVTAKYA